MEYQVNELREMISNLRLVKVYGKLTDECEVDLTTYELLLENYLTDKLISELI